VSFLKFSGVIFFVTILLILSTGILIFLSFSLTVDMNKITLFSLQTNRTWSKIPYIVFNMEKGVRLDFWMVRELVKNLEEFETDTTLSTSFLYDTKNDIKTATHSLYLVANEFYKNISDQYNEEIFEAYEEIRISLEYGIDNLEKSVADAVKKIQFWFIIFMLLIFFLVIISIVMIFYPIYRDFKYLESKNRSKVSIKELKTIKPKKSGE